MLSRNKKQFDSTVFALDSECESALVSCKSPSPVNVRKFDPLKVILDRRPRFEKAEIKFKTEKKIEMNVLEKTQIKFKTEKKIEMNPLAMAKGVLKIVHPMKTRDVFSSERINSSNNVIFLRDRDYNSIKTKATKNLLKVTPAQIKSTAANKVSINFEPLNIIKAKRFISSSQHGNRLNLFRSKRLYPVQNQHFEHIQQQERTNFQSTPLKFWSQYSSQVDNSKDFK